MNALHVDLFEISLQHRHTDIAIEMTHFYFCSWKQGGNIGLLRLYMLAYVVLFAFSAHSQSFILSIDSFVRAKNGEGQCSKAPYCRYAFDKLKAVFKLKCKLNDRLPKAFTRPMS